MTNQHYGRDYNNARRVLRRTLLKALLGDTCARCGDTDDLEFDHVDPAAKLFTISKGLLKPWPVLLAEVAKCQLLCHPCHIAKTREGSEFGGGQNKITDHGTEAYHDRTGCRCDACITGKRAAQIRRGGRGSGPSDNIYGGRGRHGTVEHGGGKTGKHLCPCDLCKARKRQYMQEYMRGKRARAQLAHQESVAFTPRRQKGRHLHWVLRMRPKGRSARL